MANPAGRKRADPNRWPGVYVYQVEQAYNHKPDLSYHITYKIDGKKVWEKVGLKSEGYTPQLAAEIRGERIKNARHGKEVKTQREIRREQRQINKTLNEIADAYIEVKGPAMKGKSAKIDQWRFQKHVAPVVGKKSVSQLSQLDLARITKNMAGMSTTSKWAALEILRRVINFGVKHQMCKPLHFKIELPTKNNVVTEYLTPEEIKRLMHVFDFWPSRDVVRMLQLAMYTGMRRGEIFALQDDKANSQSDLDFAQELIYLRGPDREGPKGGKTASIPMNSVAKEILVDQLEWRDERFPESAYVFPGIKGGLRKHCNAALKIKQKAGLPEKFRMFHGLRHHYAVSLANSGEFSLDLIGELLTHKSPGMTMRYAQFLPDTMKKASSRAGEILKGQYQAEDETENQANKKVVNIADRD